MFHEKMTLPYQTIIPGGHMTSYLIVYLTLPANVAYPN